MTEVEKEKPNIHKHTAQVVGTALVSFVISVILIFIALVILVRFWVFENILYNIFVLSFLIVGIIFNMSSINLMINEYPESHFFLPFILGSPVTLTWTIFCVVSAFFKGDIFSQFAHLPIVFYDRSFYDGLAYTPNDTTHHPFEKPFLSEHSIFEKKILLTIMLIVFTSK
jgi:hypothetical protein